MHGESNDDDDVSGSGGGAVLVCLSQLFLLTRRGEVLVWRRYRSNTPRDAPALFFRAYTHGGRDDRDDGSSSRVVASTDTSLSSAAFALCSSSSNSNDVDVTGATSSSSSRYAAACVDAPACFRVRNVHFAYVRLHTQLLLVAATTHEVSPSSTLELLTCVARVLTDYVGALTEARVRRNLALVYDVCEEMIDGHGVVQELCTARLRPFVAHDAAASAYALHGGSDDGEAAAAVVDESALAHTTASPSLLQYIERLDMATHTQRGDAATLPLLLASGNGSDAAAGAGAGSGNDVYMDVRERLHFVCDARGGVVVANVSGCVVVKSFAQRAPLLSLTLNKALYTRDDDDDKSSHHHNSSSGSSSAAATRMAVDGLWIDDADDVDATRFARERTLVLRATLGERVALRYRVTWPPPSSSLSSLDAANTAAASPSSSSAATVVAMPFRVTHSLEVQSPQHAELLLSVRAHMPGDVTAVALRVRVWLPRCTVKATATLAASAAGQRVVYDDVAQCVCWLLPQASGGVTHRCTLHLTTRAPFTPALRRQVGPVCLSFDIPQYTATSLRIQAVRLHDDNSSNNSNNNSGGGGAEVSSRSCRRWLRHVTEGVDCVYRTQA